MQHIEIDPKTGAQYPVLVYRYPDMTDEQAKAIQDFVVQVQEWTTA
mgnify:CR=1 FL=1|jgi:hypothetical protein